MRVAPGKSDNFQQCLSCPLSRQAVELLRELHVLSRRRAFLFPALGNVRLPMSENTVNAALRRLGYAHDEMTSHGFRSMASTLLNEQGWHPDFTEMTRAARSVDNQSMWATSPFNADTRSRSHNLLRLIALRRTFR
jgi:integrase